MPTHDAQPLREILHRMLVRYVTVRPHGLILQDGAKSRVSVEARIVSFGSARTLYKERRPKCRSLDGVRSVTDTDRTCADCDRRYQCTPQVRLDLVIDVRPYRLLLAHTSARNFLTYDAQLKGRKVVLEDVAHRIEVVDRGTWGELRFSQRP